jgi:hypothetical protein
MKIRILLLFTLLVGIVGCQKDELSRTKTNLSRTWVMDKVEFGGVDTTSTWKSQFVSYSIQFNKDGKYFENYVTGGFNTEVQEKGEWSLTSDAITLTLVREDKQLSRTYEIILVDETNLHVSKVGSDPKEEYYFKAN